MYIGLLQCRNLQGLQRRQSRPANLIGFKGSKPYFQYHQNSNGFLLLPGKG